MESYVQLPSINFRFHQKVVVQPPLTLRCNLSQYPKSPEYLDLKMFILGMGFVGRFFAADLKSRGWAVSGSCTSVAKKNELEELGYKSYVFDANDPSPEILEIVKDHTHLVISIPPAASVGEPMLRDKELVETILKDGRLQWLVYLSTTSVYGDCGGAWVDEEYPIRTTSERITNRLSAEEEWLSLGRNLGIAAHVFRLGGIYGPGRSAIDTILKQKPLSFSQKTRMYKNYTSRIHVADVCQALNASILRPSPRKIYNIVDDDPAPRVEVFEFAQALVEEKFSGHTEQYVIGRDESLVKGIGSRGEKRVSNSRMKKELEVKLLHPTFRSGLRSIIDDMTLSDLQKPRGS
ncbi:hypothetical protein F511_26123 [Dorcoceras hygrometricum]|uniref:NAD-dependent epimerase/dehydratase domain-containing protein n=1 Tax=Dorcoceras hygrometricum TaxID=472368 RepID=A0A2Z7D6B9_9LAMI|nr:hypothetical protein F511_26123 [Dorcoceras hygrometricum]